MAVIKPIPPRGFHEGKFFNVSGHLIFFVMSPMKKDEVANSVFSSEHESCMVINPRKTLIKEKKILNNCLSGEHHQFGAGKETGL